MRAVQPILDSSAKIKKFLLREEREPLNPNFDLLSACPKRDQRIRSANISIVTGTVTVSHSLGESSSASVPLTAMDSAQMRDVAAGYPK